MSHPVPVDSRTGKPLPVSKWDEETKRKTASLIADQQRVRVDAGKKPDFRAIKFGRSLCPNDYEDLPSDKDCDAALKATGRQ